MKNIIIQEQTAAVIFKPSILCIKPKAAILKNVAPTTPLSESIMSLAANKKTNADIALYHGRRFKVGWNFQNSFTALTTANSNKTLEKG